MDTLLIVLGVGCVAYTVAELVGAAHRLRSPRIRFSCVDAESGRELELEVDRRTMRRDRRNRSRVQALRPA